MTRVASTTAIFDPATNTWTAGNKMASRSDEETWALLPDGTVLAVECFNAPNAEKYIPSSDSWVSAGSTPSKARMTPSPPQFTLSDLPMQQLIP
jgi:hypothetical protein